MARFADPLLDRLRNKVWSRALRVQALELGRPDAASWSRLARSLMATVSPEAAIGRVQGLMGVVRHGNDPRRAVRRIDVEELPYELPSSVNVSQRVAGSRHLQDDPSAKSYLEIEVDLVEAGEKLVPGSAAWMTAPFWWLADQELPALEDVRRLITVLKQDLGLVTARTPAANRIGTTAQSPILTQRALALRYEESLQLITKNPSASAMSLMAALLIESFLDDQDLLHDMHLAAFRQMVEALLSPSLFGDIRGQFEEMVTSRFLMRPWQPPTEHRSSLYAPFLTEAQWHERTGIFGWKLQPRSQTVQSGNQTDDDQA